MGPEGKAGKDGADGADGATGANGVSIVWKGAFASDAAPELASPQVNWLYYNTTLKEARIYTADGWKTMAKDGKDGADGEKGTDALPLYGVIFVGNAGEPLSMQTVTSGGKAARPAAPVGSDLYGWYDAPDFATPYDFENKTITNHRIIYGRLATPADFAHGTSIKAFDVKNAADWGAAVAAIKNGGGAAGSVQHYAIVVAAGFDLAGATSATFGSAAYIAVSVRNAEGAAGGANPVLSLPSSGGNGYLLNIGAEQRVVLRDVTMQGKSVNTGGSLVRVDGANAALEMNGSAKIIGNQAFGGYGGGVYVNSGTFTMRDSATVSGNTASNGGGGVYVNSGTFTMRDSATVSGNTASNGGGGGVYVAGGTFTMQDSATVSGNTGGSMGGGGGVCVDGGAFTMQGSAAVSGNTAFNGGGVYVGGGIFRISGGTVYGSNEPNAALKNTATANGAALYRAGSGTAQYGTFDGSTTGIDISPTADGSDSYRNDTIKVIGGALQP